MRYLAIILIAFTVLSCKELDIIRYEYHASTQMGRTILAVTQDSVIVTFNGKGEPTYWAREVEETEWNALNSSIVDVDFNEVSKLVAPSNKRARDAAPYAKLVFVSKDSTLKSSSFDGNHPHEMLAPLMKEIIKIQEKNKM